MSPLQAEAAALLWAVEIANREKWTHVIFKGDAKACFDCLSTEDTIPVWLISTYISNIRSLSFSFISIKFSWVRRLGNAAAHKAAKFALTSCQSFFNNGNLLVVLEYVCRADFLPYSPYLV